MDLASPVDCVLFFAGEATNNYHPATVHGALESGARAAAEILECPFVGNENIIITNEVNLYAENAVVFFELNISKISIAHFSIYSLTGSKVKQLFFDRIPSGKNTWSFSVADLAVGNYILEADVDGVKYSKQVSIQH